MVKESLSEVSARHFCFFSTCCIQAVPRATCRASGDPAHGIPGTVSICAIFILGLSFGGSTEDGFCLCQRGLEVRAALHKEMIAS